MGKIDPRVDAYIAKAADFAQPILNHIRALVHQACPEVEETMKWSFPHFDYKGVMIAMAAFKKHCTLNFWKAGVMSDPHQLFIQVGETAMGQFGKITSLEDLPDDEILLAYIEEAVKLNHDGVKAPQKPKIQAKKELEIPAYFMEALSKDKKAMDTFNGFSYSNKKEYIEWVTDAKTEKNPR